MHQFDQFSPPVLALFTSGPWWLLLRLCKRAEHARACSSPNCFHWAESGRKSAPPVTFSCAPRFTAQKDGKGVEGKGRGWFCFQIQSLLRFSCLLYHSGRSPGPALQVPTLPRLPGHRRTGAQEGRLLCWPKKCRRSAAERASNNSATAGQGLRACSSNCGVRAYLVSQRRLHPRNTVMRMHASLLWLLSLSLTLGCVPLGVRRGFCFEVVLLLLRPACSASFRASGSTTTQQRCTARRHRRWCCAALSRQRRMHAHPASTCSSTLLRCRRR